MIAQQDGHVTVWRAGQQVEEVLVAVPVREQTRAVVLTPIEDSECSRARTRERARSATAVKNFGSQRLVVGWLDGGTHRWRIDPRKDG